MFSRDIYEIGAANLFGTINFGFGNWDREIILPKVLKKYGIKYNISILIHNHPYTTTPLPSPRDLVSYAEFGVLKSLSILIAEW